MWTGKTHDAFIDQVNEDYCMMKELLKDIEKLNSSIGNAKREYLRCEEMVNDAVESIRIGLGD